MGGDAKGLVEGRRWSLAESPSFALSLLLDTSQLGEAHSIVTGQDGTNENEATFSLPQHILKLPSQEGPLTQLRWDHQLPLFPLTHPAGQCMLRRSWHPSFQLCCPTRGLPPTVPFLDQATHIQPTPQTHPSSPWSQPLMTWPVPREKTKGWF
jgi:hypothetical protein